MGKLWRKTGSWAAALALVLALALPVQAAADDERRPAAVEAALDWFGSVLDGAWSNLASLWLPVGEGADPDGEPATQGTSTGPVPTPQVGEGADPNG